MEMCSKCCTSGFSNDSNSIDTSLIILGHTYYTCIPKISLCLLIQMMNPTFCLNESVLYNVCKTHEVEAREPMQLFINLYIMYVLYLNQAYLLCNANAMLIQTVHFQIHCHIQHIMYRGKEYARAHGRPIIRWFYILLTGLV